MTYGGVVALDDATMVVRPGAVHALLGENGAGKSTLVKIMTGAVRPDAGTLRLDGAEVQFANTADAVRHGVAVVSQELSLFPHLDVLSNLFPMREPMRGPLVDRKRMRALAQPVLDRAGPGGRPPGAGPGSHPGRAPARRDRQGAHSQPARAPPRRAHVCAGGGCDGAPPGHPARPAPARRGRRLRVPHPRGGHERLRRGHRAARRQGGQGRGAHGKPDDAGHRPRHARRDARPPPNERRATSPCPRCRGPGWSSRTSASQAPSTRCAHGGSRGDRGPGKPRRFRIALRSARRGRDPAASSGTIRLPGGQPGPTLVPRGRRPMASPTCPGIAAGSG